MQFMANHTNLNDTNSKQSLKRCFQGHGLHPCVPVKSTFLGMSFFLLDNFFSLFFLLNPLTLCRLQHVVTRLGFCSTSDVITYD